MNIDEQRYKEELRIYQSEIKMFLASEWEIKNANDFSTKLTKNTASTGVHIFLAIFFGWFTFLIPNIIYYFASIKRKTLVKPQREDFEIIEEVNIDTKLPEDYPVTK